MSAAVTCAVEFVAARGLWRVKVFAGGRWRRDEWFYLESMARYYAEWKERMG